MSKEQAIEFVRRNYNFPADMPAFIWHAEYGSYAHPNPYAEAVDVWEVSATGADLVDYFIPGEAGPPAPNRVFTAYIDDKQPGIFLARISG
ncbi:MAG: hypothetical protein ACRDFX_07365 [Chloroflexota bacterium]